MISNVFKERHKQNTLPPPPCQVIFSFSPIFFLSFPIQSGIQDSVGETLVVSRPQDNAIDPVGESLVVSRPQDNAVQSVGDGLAPSRFPVAMRTDEPKTPPLQPNVFKTTNDANNTETTLNSPLSTLNSPTSTQVIFKINLITAKFAYRFSTEKVEW